jgi:hypothetical protein
LGQQTVLEEVRQEFYTSQEDCQHDWGTDDRDCTPVAPNGASGSSGASVTHSGGGSGGYYGPRYYWDRENGYPVALGPGGETRVLANSYLSKSAPSFARGNNSVGHVAVVRGGFGGIAHGFSAGG